MATGIRKMLDLGPMDYPGDTEDLTYPGNLQKVLDTGTKFVRIWMRWPKAMPAPNTFDWNYIANIDAQIALARQYDIGVVLVSWEFPRWSNGTVNQPANYQSQDRLLGYNSDGTPRYKAFEQGVPVIELGVGGYWGAWISWLIGRYGKYGCGVILELFNEPNFQWWPQQDSSGNITSSNKAAEMMQTAATVSSMWGYPMPIAAPASSDTRRATTRMWTNYQQFMTELRTDLLNLNFHGHPTFMWSHHNYADVETGNYNGYAHTWNSLYGWWHGWSATAADGTNPGIWITEGGCRLTEVGGNLNTQASRVGGMYQVMAIASGVQMFTNYLLHTVPSYDTGLMNPWPNATKRPVWNTFHNMPAL